MKLTLRAWVEVEAGPEASFELATDPSRFPDFFPGNLLVPAVRSVELQGDPPPAPGMLRTVRNADGSCMTECVDAFEPPRVHRYRLVDGFEPPARWMVREAEAAWQVEAAGSGARIDWQYGFHLTHPLLMLLAWPTLGIFFRRAMRDCLARMGAELGGVRAAG